MHILNSNNGIYLYQCKDFVIQENKFKIISDNSIFVNGNSRGEVIENIFYSINGNGCICSNSDIRIRKNAFQAMLYSAVAVCDGSTASIIDNKFEKIQSNGLFILDSKLVEIENNEISEIQMSGISISNTKMCIIKNSTIKNCKISSIKVYNNSNATVEGNRISNIRKFCFSAFTGGTIIAKKK